MTVSTTDANLIMHRQHPLAKVQTCQFAKFSDGFFNSGVTFCVLPIVQDLHLRGNLFEIAFDWRPSFIASKTINWSNYFAIDHH